MEFKTTNEWTRALNQLMYDLNEFHQILLDTQKHVLLTEFENIQHFLKDVRQKLRPINKAFNQLIRLHYADVPPSQRTSMFGGDLDTARLLGESTKLLNTKGQHLKYKTRAQLATQTNTIRRDVDTLTRVFQVTHFQNFQLKSEKRVFLDMEKMLYDIESTIYKTNTKLCKTPKKLIGPITLTILDRKRDNARIVLLGDRHVLETKCAANGDADRKCETPNVIQYLDNVFYHFVTNRPSEHLDFFLEMPFSEEIRVRQDIDSHLQEDILFGHIEDNYLSSLRIYFYNCLQKQKDQCQFFMKHSIDHSPIVRFHYADTRQGVIHTQTKEDSKVVIRQLQRFWKLEVQKLKPSDLTWALEFVEKMEHLEENVDFFFHLAKIDKQLRKINDPFVTVLMKSNFIQTFKRDADMKDLALTKSTAQHLYDGLKFGLTLTVGDVKLFDQLQLRIGGFLLYRLFDVYVATRIIRHKMKHVIVYAGAAHTRNLTFIFLAQGYEITTFRESDRTESKQCIDMRNVPQPWF